MSHIYRKTSRALGFSRLTNRFVRSENGAVVVEFAFMLPIFVTLFLGFAVAAKGQQLSTYNGKTAAVVADLIAQSQKLQKDEIDAALLAGEAIAGATDGARIEIGVFGVEIKDNGSTEVHWARGLNGAQLPAVGGSYALPATLTTEAGFAVVSETKLSYSPAVGKTFFGDVDFSAKNYFIPRIAEDMKCTDC